MSLESFNTMKNSEIAHPHTKGDQPHQGPATTCALDARNHYPQIKHHTPPPSGATTPAPSPNGQRTSPGVVSGPNSVFSSSACLQKRRLLLCTQPPPTTGKRLLTAHTPTTGMLIVVLLRKEVIQPHLPVRLPCYDFVPIADPTFDSSPHKG